MRPDAAQRIGSQQLSIAVSVRTAVPVEEAVTRRCRGELATVYAICFPFGDHVGLATSSCRAAAPVAVTAAAARSASESRAITPRAYARRVTDS